MKAVQYKVHNCVVDEENDIHVILVNEESGFFVPLWVPFDQGQLLLMNPKDEIPDEIKYLLTFTLDTWTKLGYTVKSIVIDHQGEKGLLLSTITFVQNQFDQRYIYLTCFIPVTTAFLMSVYFDISLYLTSKVEGVVKKISLSQLESYIESVKVDVEEEEDEDDEEGN